MDEAFVRRNNVKLSCKGSHVLVHAAEKQAAAMGVPECIAVVDEGGNLLAFSRMDGARIGSASIAINKAVTAATRLRPSGEDGGGAFEMGVKLSLAGERLTNIAGGLPVVVDGAVIGAIGVSSGTPDQDVEVAQAALKAFAEG